MPKDDDAERIQQSRHTKRNKNHFLLLMDNFIEAGAYG